MSSDEFPAPVAAASTANSAATIRTTTPSANTALAVDRSAPWQRYYAAVTAYVQTGLVSLRGTDNQLAGPESVRIAVRRSSKGTLLLALFNAAERPAAVAVVVDGVAQVALDLATETELPLSTRGYQSQTTLTMPRNGWKLIAFAASRKDLDDERNAPRLKARIR